MTRLAMLVGSFLVTFTLLLSLWMFSFGFAGLSGPAATPTPSPSPYYTLAATAPPATVTPPAPTFTARPTQSPTPPPTATPAPTPVAQPSPTPVAALSFSPPPMRTPPGSLEPLPSTEPAGTQTFVVAGSAFVTSDVPSNGRLAAAGEGVLLETTSGSSDALWITYRLSPEELPVGVIIQSVDVKVCGQGEGSFWEVYGPPGSNPAEYEVVPPAADGCWHFEDAPTSDVSAIAATMLDSRLRIDRVEFTITFGR